MILIKKLSRSDGREVFEMLKGIDTVENAYTNPTYIMSFPEFQEWLLEQEEWDKGNNLPKGYVAQSIYWLYDGDTPVGMGKIRHGLTENSRKNGGNIGYAISRPYRGKGYGSAFLKMLLEEARTLGIEEIILTIDKYNKASKSICENNGGILFDENAERWFYRFQNKEEERA